MNKKMKKRSKYNKNKPFIENTEFMNKMKRTV